MTAGGRPASWWLTWLVLVVLSAWLLISPPAPRMADGSARLAIGLLCAAPLLLLLVTGLGRRPRWGAWVAVVMIPYLALGVGALLVTPSSRASQAVFSGLTVLAFFAGLDATRRPQKRP